MMKITSEMNITRTRTMTCFYESALEWDNWRYGPLSLTCLDIGNINNSFVHFFIFLVIIVGLFDSQKWNYYKIFKVSYIGHYNNQYC